MGLNKYQCNLSVAHRHSPVLSNQILLRHAGRNPANGQEAHLCSFTDTVIYNYNNWVSDFSLFFLQKKRHKATETFIKLNCECKLNELQSLKRERPYVTKICNGMWGMMTKINRRRWLCGNSDGFMGRSRSSSFNLP